MPDLWHLYQKCPVDRLHRDNKTLYSEYRSEGMMRFIEGQYHSSESTGAMLAYILDGDTKRALAGLSTHLQNHLAKLKTTSPVFNPYEKLNDERLFISNHQSKHHTKLIHALLSPPN